MPREILITHKQSDALAQFDSIVVQIRNRIQGESWLLSHNEDDAGRLCLHLESTPADIEPPQTTVSGSTYIGTDGKNYAGEAAAKAAGVASNPFGDLPVIEVPASPAEDSDTYAVQESISGEAHG